MLRYVLFGTALLWSCWVFGTEIVWTKAEYKREVVRLLDEYARLHDAGVFLEDAEIATFDGNSLEFSYPRSERDGHPPGMFFSRPPGKTWLNDVQALQKIKVEGGFKSECYKLPLGMHVEFICGTELIRLYTATTGEQELDEQDSVMAQMRLGLICDEHRKLCDLKTDAEYEAEFETKWDAMFKGTEYE